MPAQRRGEAEASPAPRAGKGATAAAPRAKGGRPPVPVELPTEVVGGDAEVAGRLASIEGWLRRIDQTLARLTAPSEVVGWRDACRLIGRSRQAVKQLDTRAVFTDARAPECRIPRSPRLYYVAELEVYKAEGSAGVRKLRKDLGRL